MERIKNFLRTNATKTADIVDSPTQNEKAQKEQTSFGLTIISSKQAYTITERDGTSMSFWGSFHTAGINNLQKDLLKK